MIVTPTAKSQGLAGVGFWLILWSLIAEAEKIAKMLRLGNWVNQERIYEWIRANKTISMIGSECINMYFHRPDTAAAVVFCLGGTCINFVMIYLVIPTRQGIRRLIKGEA